MDDGTSGVRYCEVCGGPLRSDNKTGICTRNRDCQRHHLRASQARCRETPTGNRAPCSHPDGCPNESVKHKLCGMHFARWQKTGDLGPVGPVRAVRYVVAPGDVFGKLAAIETYDPERRNVLCRCECGNEKRIAPSVLVNGKVTDCGCITKKPPRRRKPPEHPYIRAGEVFGRLTALNDAVRSSDKVRCRCECGANSEPLAVTLKFKSRSCGCLREERKWRHGLTAHPLYSTWKGILGRTTNPDDPSYVNYGGRGIQVCERWQDLRLFVEDIERGLGPRPDGCTLDRIDNESGYEIANVRWANSKTQSTNKRTVGTLTRERDALAAELEATRQALAEARGVLF